MSNATQQDQIAVRAGQVVRLAIPAWLRDREHLLSRELEGEVVATTPASITVRGHASMRESATCHRCGLEIINPVSRFVGYGPICSEYLGIPRDFAPEQVEAMRLIGFRRSAFETTFPTRFVRVVEVLREAPAGAPPAPAPVKAPAEGTITLTETAIVVAGTPYEYYDRCKAVRGRWDPTRRAWSYPRTAETARALATAFAGTAVEFAPAFVALSEEEPVPDPYPEGRAYVRDDVVYLQGTPFEYYDRCKSVMGGRWDGPLKAWKFRAGPTVAREIARAFAGTRVDLSDAAFVALLSEADARDRAQEYKQMGEEDLPQPAGLKTRLWKHQLRAFHFTRQMPGAHLFMGMGTGKTLTTIARIVDSGARRVLVLCPKKVVATWPEEWAKHAAMPAIVCALGGDESVAKKAEKARAALAEGERTGQTVIVVVNYEAAWRPPFGPTYGDRSHIVERGFALGVEWDFLVCDENHRVKDPNGKASRFCRQVGARAKARLGLTGTPIVHDPLDIWAQYAAISPEVFGTHFGAFKRRYAIMGGYLDHEVVGYQLQDELQAKMYSVAFRATKDVLELPEQHHVWRHAALTPAEQKAYDTMERQFVVGLEEGTVSAANVLVQLLRLAQLASGFVTDAETGQTHEFGRTRLDLLEEVVDEIGPDEPVVVFARFVRDLGAVRASLEATGRTVGEISGRHNDLAAFKRGEVSALVVQLQSGGVGIDLTRCGARSCHYCVYYGVDFNWGAYEQSLSRIHRPGQTETTTFVHLATAGIDDKIRAVLDQRGDLIEAVLTERAF